MAEEESSLFQIRLNEQGIKFIRRFATISYTMLVLVIFESIISIYWTTKILTMDNGGIASTLYDKVYPYLSISLSLLSVVFNIYYFRFPIALLRSIKLNDEFGANRAFRLLFSGALIYFLWLLLVSAMLIWSLTQTRTFM